MSTRDPATQAKLGMFRTSDAIDEAEGGRIGFGRGPQAHARHRFQVLADMTTATGRVQRKLGGTS